MKNKKILIISILALLVIFLLLYLFFAAQKLNPNPTSKIPSIDTITGVPQEEKFNINNITVNNFYKTADKLKPNGEVRLKETPNYQLIFTKNHNYFLISIISSPFESSRIQAENAFLAQLGVDKREACSLNVNETTPIAINPDQAGRLYKLSFCP